MKKIFREQITGIFIDQTVIKVRERINLAIIYQIRDSVVNDSCLRVMIRAIEQIDY